MDTTVPQLKVYYIDLDTPTKIDDIKSTLTNSSIVTNYAKIVAYSALAAIPPITIIANPVILKRFYDNNRYFVIHSEEELSHFENANNNEWIINNKSLRKRQYYIQHPKKSKSNLLIEAQSFYSYIEEELRKEVLDYVQSHCPAKTLIFSRQEVNAKNAGLNLKIKTNTFNPDVNTNGNFSQNSETLISFKNTTGTIRPRVLEEYLWLDDSVKLGIRALEGGHGTFSKSFYSDQTFGLTALEANTLGLNMNFYKKFKYSLTVEC